MSKHLDTVKVFSDKPLSLSDLLRIASQKIKSYVGTASFINILDSHYFKEHNVYVVLYSTPVFVTVASERGMEQEAR